ncbi:MAG: hypothetical protein JXA21_11730 [Anaerolineae bacterium]|nr:hypothetical protein [Anaerolineae bacterium]
MRIKRILKPGGWLGYLGLLSALLIVGMLPSLAQAAPPALPPRPSPTPTLTPTPTLIPTPTPQVVNTSPGASGSLLELAVRASDQAMSRYNWKAMWTVVQWQDADATWHDVEGWRDVLDTIDATGGSKRWSVPDSLFGRGPFRWLVYDREGGVLLATSATYQLPTAGGQTVRVEVTLPDAAPVPALLPVTGAAFWDRAGLVGAVLLCFFCIAFLIRRR